MAQPNQPNQPDMLQAVLAPDAYAAQINLARRQKIADAIMQQSQDPMQGQMVSGHYIRPGVLAPVNKLLATYLGMKMNNENDIQQANIGKIQAAELAKYLQGGNQSAPADTGTPTPPGLSASSATAFGDPSLATPDTASPQSSAQPAQPQSPFGMNQLGMQGMAIQRMYGDEAYKAWLAQQAPAPTDTEKLSRLAGVDPRAAAVGRLLKDNYIAPTSLRPGGVAVYSDGRQEQMPSAIEGSQAVRNADGTWSYRPMAGAIPAMADEARTKASGAATFKLEKVWNPQANQFEFQPATNVSAAAGGVPVQGASTPGFPSVNTATQSSRNSDRLFLLQQELKNNPNDPALKAEIAKTQAAVQSGNPYSVTTGNMPVQRGAMAAEPPLGKTANANVSQEAGGKSMAESYGALQKSRAGGGSAIQDIDHMLELSAKKSPLVAGDYSVGVAKLFSPNAAVYEKSRDNLVTQLSGQLGMSTDAARDMVYGSIPSYGAPKEAIKDGLTNLRNQVQLRMIKGDFLTPHFNAGDSNKYNSKENEFDQNIYPALVPLLTMPSGSARASALKNAASDPKKRASLEWAAQNGLLK